MRLKINESKTLEFEMDASGVSWKELQGFFRLTLENIEYGFPVNIDEGVVTVDIPIIKDVLHESVRTALYEHREVTVKARLDLIANNEAYINPWSGEIDIEIPVSVKVTEERGKEKIVKVVDPDIKEYLDEEKKKDRKSKLMESFDKPLDTKKEKKIEENQEVVEDKKPEKIKSKFSKMLD